MTAIGIVGAGAVGQATAVALTTAGLGDDLILVSRTFPQAAALATDLQDHCTALARRTRTRAGTTTDLRSCDAVVIAARAPFDNTHTQDIRLAGLHANATIITGLAHALTGYQGIVLVVTNPVDLLTRLLADLSGIPRIYGIGSALDTARYRTLLAHRLAVPVTAIAGHVIGEHGDAAVICASTTTVHGQPLHLLADSIRTQLHTRPHLIRTGTGRVRAGAAGATVSALHKTLGRTDGIEELCTAYQDGWLGVPLHFTNGQPELAMPTLNPHEHHQFTAAQAKLRATYQTLRPDLREHP